MSNDVERFRFVTYDSDPDYVYLDNPSCMTLYHTKKWFEEVLGKENIQIYAIGGMFGGFCNAFKYRISEDQKVAEFIAPELVKDGEHYRRKETLSEANQI